MKIDSRQNIKEFLINNVLFNRNGDNTPGLEKKLSYIRRERIEKPMIYVGMTTCAVVAGAEKTFNAIKEYLNENSLDIELIEGGCIGLCSKEPLVDIQMPGKSRISFGNVTYDKVQMLLDEALNNNIPDDLVLGQYKSNIHQMWEHVPFIEDLPFFTKQKKSISEGCGIIDPVSIEEYIAIGGYTGFTNTINKFTPSQVCSEIEDSLLLGRGGGGFSTGKKWSISLNKPSEQKYLVCNAVEGDPGSYMNRYIIESIPHRLIEAVLIAAYATNTTKAYIFIREEFKLPIKRLKQALQEAYDFGLIGHNIFDSGVNIDIVIKEGARAFVCGEETALNNSIEGKRAMPKSKPPYPAEKGLWNKPTVVNNVETLINVPLIMKNGAGWYKQTGTDISKGTKLFTLSGKIKNYGTIEVPMGVSFKNIIDEIGDGIKENKQFKAIILGINSGSYITEETLDVKVDFKELKDIGSALGSGAFVVLDETSCMVDIAKFFTRFFKRESCGKCIPCREGTARMYEILESATTKPEDKETYKPLERFKSVMQLKPLSKVMKETSLCSLGRSAPNAVLNTLQFFKDEFDAHIFERKCPANICSELKVYSIDVEKCTGCTACFKKCPVNAIIGSPNVPHFIIEEKCIGCGSCFDACKFNAVIIK